MINRKESQKTLIVKQKLQVPGPLSVCDSEHVVNKDWPSFVVVSQSMARSHEWRCLFDLEKACEAQHKTTKKARTLADGWWKPREKRLEVEQCIFIENFLLSRSEFWTVTFAMKILRPLSSFYKARLPFDCLVLSFKARYQFSSLQRLVFFARTSSFRGSGSYLVLTLITVKCAKSGFEEVFSNFNNLLMPFPNRTFLHVTMTLSWFLASKFHSDFRNCSLQAGGPFQHSDSILSAQYKIRPTVVEKHSGMWN